VEALKNALAVLVGIIGVATAFLTLYAKYLDVKKSTARESDDAKATTPVPTVAASPPEPIGGFLPANYWAAPIARDVPPAPALALAPDLATIARARRLVKAPAIALIVAGALSLFLDLVMPMFVVVDQFVVPLTTETKQKRASIEAVKQGEVPIALGTASLADASSTDASMVLGAFMMVALSIPSAAAIWAGIGMLRLRSYWLSMAGSFAIMAATAPCCLFGVPVGAWSLSVLYKREVVASFR
jgi:hypothetical protein